MPTKNSKITPDIEINFCMYTKKHIIKKQLKSGSLNIYLLRNFPLNS